MTHNILSQKKCWPVDQLVLRSVIDVKLTNYMIQGGQCMLPESIVQYLLAAFDQRRRDVLDYRWSQDDVLKIVFCEVFGRVVPTLHFSVTHDITQLRHSFIQVAIQRRLDVMNCFGQRHPARTLSFGFGNVLGHEANRQRQGERWDISLDVRPWPRAQTPRARRSWLPIGSYFTDITPAQMQFSGKFAVI